MGNFSDNSKDTATADDFRGCFDHTQPPTPFPTAHTAASFLHQKGSGPPDTD